MTILKSAGHVSEVYYASEFVCFLMTTFTLCTSDGNVPNSRNVEAFSVRHIRRHMEVGPIIGSFG